MNEIETTQLRNTVRDFLNAHRKAVFAFLDVKGYPTTSLMLYTIDDDLHVYFGTRKSFGKYADVQRNPIVSLSVIEEVLDPLRVVDVRGTAVELSAEEQERVYAQFKEHNISKYYVEHADDFVMFRITPHFIRWADASSGELVVTDVPLV